MATALFSIPPNQIADLHRVLDPTQFKRATYQIVKRTTDQGRRIASKAVSERLTIPKKYIDDPKQRHSAIRATTSGEPPVGNIVIRDKALPLGAFRVTGGKKTGLVITIDKSVSPIRMRHGFRAKVASAKQKAMGVSHQGIFSRKKISGAVDAWWKKTWGDISPQQRADWQAAGLGPGKQFNDRMAGVTARGFAWRLPIREHFGPSILDFISRGEIYNRILKDIGDTLQKNVDSQVGRFLNGKTLQQAVDNLIF